MKSVRFISLIQFLVLAGCVSAQSQDTLTYPYKITGTVYDDKGNPLPGANIVSPGDGNMQTSDIDGKYYANIYGPNTAVVFSCYKFSSVLYCPDGRNKIDIVLSHEKGWWFKKMTWRIGYLFKSKREKRAGYSCS